CRGLGMDIDPDRMIAAARALEYVDLTRRSDVYHALRAVIVTRQRDIEWFDQAFREFWRRPSEGYTTLDLHSMGEQRYKHKTQFLRPTGSSPDDEAEAGKPAVDPTLVIVVPTYSNQAALRSKDFAQMTGEELDAAKASLAQLPRSLGLRRSRRY